MNSFLKVLFSVFQIFVFALSVQAAEIPSVSTQDTKDIIEQSISKDEPIRYQGKTRFNYYHKAAHFNEKNDLASVSSKSNLRSSSPLSSELPYQGYAKPDGIITTYDVYGNACAFPHEMYEQDGYIRVAISGEQWNNGANCGKCFKIIGKGTGIGTMPFVGEHDVIVTNLCPECPTGHFDLLQEGNGIWDIEYYEQECRHHEYNDPKFKTNGGSQEYMLRFQIIDTPAPVASVYLTENPAATMEKAWDNYWVYYDPTVLGNQMWQYPVSITYTLENGEQRTGNIYITDDYQSL